MLEPRAVQGAFHLRRDFQFNGKPNTGDSPSVLAWFLELQSRKMLLKVFDHVQEYPKVFTVGSTFLAIAVGLENGIPVKLPHPVVHIEII